MNGDNVKVLAIHDLDSPDGLTVDYHMSNRLFWTDHKTSIIESIKYDGSDRVKITHISLNNPLKIDIFETNIYWLSREHGSINSVDKFGRGANKQIIQGLELTDDIKIYHKYKIPANGKKKYFDFTTNKYNSVFLCSK